MSGGSLPAAPIAVHWDWSRIQSLLLNSVSSEHSRRAYAKALNDFRDWCIAAEAAGFTKATVQSYRASLEATGLSASSINVRLTAIRRLAQEAADNGLLAADVAGAVGRVKGIRQKGVRAGNWLTREQASALVAHRNRTEPRELRDRAMLCLLVGCGLRRGEVASLRIGDIQQRDGRWVILDLAGKRGRIRTVPMPGWAKAALDDWFRIAPIQEGCVFRALKDGRVTGEGLSPQAVFLVVKKYSACLGVEFAPHDLRRTFAKLAHKGHVPLEQIQLSLGHDSIVTTERYLGIRQDLIDAPCDHLGLDLEEVAMGSTK